MYPTEKPQAGGQTQGSPYDVPGATYTPPGVPIPPPFYGAQTPAVMPAATKPDDTPLRTRLKETMELIGKSLLALTGFCYLLGLIVTNINLSRYGYFSLSLLQLNYVFAGFWTLLPCFLGVPLGMLAVVIFAGYEEVVSRLTTGEKKWMTMTLMLGSMTASFMLIKLCALLLGLHFSWWWLLAAFFGVAILNLLRLSIVLSFVAGVSLIRLLTFYFLTCFISIIYLSLFARFIYRDIPAGMGGGRPAQVRLVVEKDAVPYIYAAGVGIGADQITSEPVDMILAAGDEYVVKPGAAARTVIIPRSSVKAILYEER